jgi:hypothetical protein
MKKVIPLHGATTIIVFSLVTSSALMAEEAPKDPHAFNVTCLAPRLIAVLDTG